MFIYLLQISRLDQRRQIRASGDDPLQIKFRKLTDALLKKYTGEDDEESEDEEDTELGSNNGDSDDLVEVSSWDLSLSGWEGHVISLLDC